MAQAQSQLAALISYFLLSFIRPRKLKAHVGIGIRYEVPEDAHNSRLPDVSLRFSDMPALASGTVSQMPDLAVEIQSPTDRPHQMREKALYYLSKGSQVIWLLYPAARQVEICTLSEDGSLIIQVVTSGDMLTAGEVLPDFELALDELFSEL